MARSIPADPTAELPDAPATRPRRHTRQPLFEPGVRYALIIGALLLAAVILQLAIHEMRTDPRDTRAIAERELRLNALRPGERVIRSVSVVRRSAINYFRATNGLLVFTNQRLLYLGVEPRDPLGAGDLPPTFEERDFAMTDTLVRVSSGRTFFGLSRAIVIATPHAVLRLGVPSEARTGARTMLAAMDERHQRAVALAITQQQSRARAEAQRRAAEANRHKPKYYTVRRGDALASIAVIWNTTPDRLRQWNRLPDNRIRAGQVLLVRPALRSRSP